MGGSVIDRDHMIFGLLTAPLLPQYAMQPTPIPARCLGVVIPVYNEEPTLHLIVEKVPATLATIPPALASATPIQPSLHTDNRWTFDVPAGASWIRIAQNWHPGWLWKIPGHDWKPFHNGTDAACWIAHLPAGTQRIEAQFFPRPQWLTLTSLGAALAWLALASARLNRRPLPR
jgi:hypothetical protein